MKSEIKYDTFDFILGKPRRRGLHSDIWQIKFSSVTLGPMARELHDIIESLLDKDGSCRDLNFEAPTWAGVKDLLDCLEGTFGEVSGTDQEGQAIAAPLRGAVFAESQNRGYVHLIFHAGTGIVKNLQVFISSEDDGTPFVELTFFPDDIEPTQCLRSDFIAWAHQMQMRLRARRYYARYENISWQFGDTGAESGVFLVSDVPKSDPEPTPT
jgi:hypothetical protein